MYSYDGLGVGSPIEDIISSDSQGDGDTSVIEEEYPPAAGPVGPYKLLDPTDDPRGH